MVPSGKRVSTYGSPSCSHGLRRGRRRRCGGRRRLLPALAAIAVPSLEDGAEGVGRDLRVPHPLLHQHLVLRQGDLAAAVADVAAAEALRDLAEVRPALVGAAADELLAAVRLVSVRHRARGNLAAAGGCPRGIGAADLRRLGLQNRGREHSDNENDPRSAHDSPPLCLYIVRGERAS
jgi:hypothetical protein